MSTSNNSFPTLPQSVLEKIHPLEREFATYCRELPRLLEEGEGGRYALIKGDEVISIWDTQRDAIQAGCERYGLEPFAVKTIDLKDVQRLQQLQEKGIESPCPS